MFLGQTFESSDGWATVYLPLTAATLLVVGLAGVEFQIYRQTVAAEKQLVERQRHEQELQALERQHTFNTLWQSLADHRGAATLPASILHQLAGLFSADLVAVWSADPAGDTFTLRGADPIPAEGAVRLDKVAHMSPCFDHLRNAQRLVCVTDFERHTTRAFSWFCEEHGYTQAILCPILVRRAMVGVLVFFYRDKTARPPRTLEEMQSAANLFLCAL
jgi:transcriptional regulator with GAF, ATPase, and Fis domain